MTTKQAYVGMDLSTSGGDIIRAIIEAIQVDNEGVLVEDYAVYKKVKAPGKIVLRRQTVEECLGSDWDMDGIHLYMTSYFGFIEDWDEDGLIISWDNKE